MSESTIRSTRGTYISAYNKDADYSGASDLKTCACKSESIGRTAEYTALLQFAIPLSIQYKKITKVVLNYYMGVRNFGSVIPEVVRYVSYLQDDITVPVTYNNVGTVGTIGAEKEIRTSSDRVNKWVLEDITEIALNNFASGNYSVFICAGMSASESGPYHYVSSEDASLTITYEDVEQQAPTISYPSGVYVRQGEPVLFSWIYNSLTAATQASVEIGWKLSTDSDYTTINLQTTAYSYRYDGELPQGVIDWRIKVTNNVGETSDYTYARFTVIGKPAIPVITSIENKSLTTINWNASDQCAYEIALMAGEMELIRETVYSGKQQYKPNMFLANGTYTVKLRMKNSIDLWSDETAKTVTISPSAPAVPTITLMSCGTKNIINVTRAAGTKAAVYRDSGSGFVAIAMLPDGVDEYVDDTVTSDKEYVYKVRAFADGYSDSVSKSSTVFFDGFILQNEVHEVECRVSENKYLSYAEDSETEKVLKSYAGREYPVEERGQLRSMVLKRNVVVYDDDVAKLKDIEANGKAYYRDSIGNAFPVSISVQIKRYMDIGYNVDISIARIHEEGVILNE